MRTKSDREIRQAVLQEFSWDPRVEEMCLGVSVENGVVTVTGIVSDDAKRLAAVEAARRVPGVHGVIDNVQISLRGD